MRIGQHAIPPLARYRWGNNAVRASWKGHIVRVLARGAKGTILIEDVEDGRRMTTSWRAVSLLGVRKAKVSE